MEFGPIQEWWLMRLEMYPERQADACLGRLVLDAENPYRACCLGELLICHKLYNGASFDDLWCGDELVDDDHNAEFPEMEVLTKSWTDLGLHGEGGDALQSFEISHPDDSDERIVCESLAEANDNGLSWPEIAKLVRDNPENFFSKSV